ncbi:hypothetical protein PENSPDRAFT_679628 [Peniophora sp. CONT]|nr:hypothetical protein PENSPDRAFT_679628 [Peniophora sp. CONT]
MADDLKTAQYFIFVTQAYFCAGYAVVLWDWLTCLPREWYLIWKTRWTPVKCAYLFCRYWSIAVVPYLLFCFVVNHSRETCERIYQSPVALALWNQAGAETVLLIRTYAFFNRDIRVLIGMGCALASIIAYQLYVAASQMLPLPFVTPPFDEGPCLPMSKPHSAHLLGFFIAPLAFDAIVTFMTIVKAVYIRRRNGGPSSRLIQTFLREGVFYFVLISIANLINGIFYLQPRQVISAINIPLSVMLSPVIACRLILDLRERGSESVAYTNSHQATWASRGSNAAVGLAFSTHRTGSSSVQNSPTRSRLKKNTGLALGTFGSVSGVGLDSAVELGDVPRTPRDKEMGVEDDIAEMDYRAVELGGVVTGIRIEVEKTTTSDPR